ncbi:MAG: hypothetical protein ACHQ6U_02165 [Thermodesulfobacteriota bacterium]
MLDTEIKFLGAIEVIDVIIKMGENQEKLRNRLKSLTEEVEQLKHMVMERV